MKRFSFLLIALFSLLSTSNVKAHDFEVDGIYYNITSNEEQTVEVTYKGDSYLFSDVYTGTIVIPETVIYNEITYRVTGVGTNAFTKAYFGNNEERKGPEIVEIPNTVHYIGDGAFCGCTGLKTVEMSNSTISIGTSAFQYCHNLASFIIENNITHIGDKAFYNCNNLNCAISAIVGNNTTYIGEDAFYECVNLTGKLIIPESITDISSSAFSRCSSITSVEIHNGVTSIGESAFYGCSGIKTVINFSNLTFSKGSNDNGYIACYADEVINAPNGSFVGDFVFGEIESKKTLVRYIGNETEIILPDRYKDENYTIGQYAFLDCSNITSILLSNSITEIGAGAFSGCDNITSLTIPVTWTKWVMKIY